MNAPSSQQLRSTRMFTHRELGVSPRTFTATILQELKDSGDLSPVFVEISHIRHRFGFLTAGPTAIDDVEGGRTNHRQSN